VAIHAISIQPHAVGIAPGGERRLKWRRGEGIAKSGKMTDAMIA
jgi:hypothetical protein